MPTDPLTGSRYPSSSAAPNVAQDIQNAVIDLADNTVPRFASTAARDTAYSAMVSAGGVMADGMQCTVNGVPYRRINGTWRQDSGPRIIYRSTTPNSTIAAGGGNETGVTSGIPALASFTLYEAAIVGVDGAIRAGGAGGAAVCFVKIGGTQVGNAAVARSDSTVNVTGAVSLAAGTYSVSVHVDGSGATIVWVDAFVKLTVGQVE